jgi:small conductance mechanosensitive channel
MMSNLYNSWLGFAVSNGPHLLGILIITLILLWLARKTTNRLIAPATAAGRAAQMREQQSRASAHVVYRAAAAVVWLFAVLTALPEFGISALPGTVIAGAGIFALGLGMHHVIRDVVGGFQIVLEDQFVVGDTIEAGTVSGRVEQITLRRTVVRDARGALVSMGNGEIRAAGNLSRDWSQAFVDIEVAASWPVDQALQAVEGAAAELRADASWSQALVDGPRILGVQGSDATTCTIRLQVRTAPMRQEEVGRELRRRIQMEFQKQRLAPDTGRLRGSDSAENGGEAPSTNS